MSTEVTCSACLTASSGHLDPTTCRMIYRGRPFTSWNTFARNVLLQLRRMNERGVFLRGMVKWMGFQQTAIEFDAGPRFAGVSKYPLRAMLQFALEGMTSFSNTPLYIALYFGFVVSFLSFLYAAYVIYAKFYLGQMVPGWASILTAVLFLGGVQLSTIGMIGVYLAKVFQEVKGRPRYIIRQVVGSR